MRSPNLPYFHEGLLAGEAPSYVLPEIGAVALLPHMANTESEAARTEQQRLAAQRAQDAKGARNLEAAKEIRDQRNS